MMSRAAMLGAAVCLGLGMAQAQDKQDKAEWKEFTSKEGRFTVLLPGNPKEAKNDIPGPNGTTIELKMFMVDGGSKAHIVAYQDNAEAIKDADQQKKLLERVRDAVAGKFKSKVLESKDLKVADKHTGLEFQVKVPAIKGLYRSRVFLVGKRLYQVTVVGPEGVVTSKESDRYLDSMKLTE